MYLNLYDYQVDGVFINRILPDDTGSEFMNRWRDIQKKYIDELERVFAEVPVTKIPWYSKEVRGKEAIELVKQKKRCKEPSLAAGKGALGNPMAPF